MNNQFPRGSEWRRWDLHVHTPASALENRFNGGWDAYIDALETKAQSANVAVIGVTDYCSIEGYKALHTAQEGGRLPGILLIPNVEFRVSVQTREGGAINLHVLFSPNAGNHIDKIERVLENLSFHYHESPHNCTRSQLIELGRASDATQTDDNGAYKVGVNIFKPELKDFKNWWKSEIWLRENALVAIDNGSSDGASGLSQDAGFRAVREEIYRFSQIIFSPKPACRKYFLGQGADNPKLVKQKCGKLMPCIHGSDAHSIETLFEPDHQRYCWIKADPTFEGLRQILYEPEERVHIGATAPESFDANKVIDEVKFDAASDWFGTAKLELNSRLVTIIGEKGSGKTALADVIAHACGAWQETPTSFLKKARGLLKGATANVKWRSGMVSTAPLDGVPAVLTPQVRYLSQDFVERLCTDDHTGSELLKEIEEVIFSYIQEEDRLGASTFQELRVIKTQSIQKQRSTLRSQISSLNADIVHLEDAIASKSEKEERLKTINQEADAIGTQIPTLEGSTDQQVVNNLKTEREKLQSRSRTLTEVNRSIERVKEAQHSVTRLKEAIETEFSKLRDVLGHLGLTVEQIDRFRPTFQDNFDVPLQEKATQLAAEAQLLRGDPSVPKPDGDTVADIRCRIEALEKNLSNDEKLRERLIALQRDKARLEKEKENISKEIITLDTKTLQKLTESREARLKLYHSYFDLLREEESTLSGLYEPLSRHLHPGNDSARGKFELSIRRIIDLDAWATNGENLIDRRKARAFRAQGALADYAHQHILPSWEGSDQGMMGAAISALLAEFLGDNSIVDQVLSSHATRVQFYDWLFSPEHIRLTYNLKYDGTDLEYLSPGTRGILLLVLYLEMDKDDRRPLIIDQPEGNLDNSSIYDSLVPYLRRAKQYRQIILVTHNPNLVVTTDAEQIIVASSSKNGKTHPVIEYNSGSLECSANEDGIRQAVCRLLEGGEDAFRKREEKYALRQE